MIRKTEGWNLVLAGFWNRMIFTPEWVGPRLFPDTPEIETLVALLPVLPITYRDRDVAMEVAMTRIVLRPRNLADDAAMGRIEAMARTILTALPETPVQALGTNFGYREEDPLGSLLAMFNDVDDTELGQEGWQIGERKITRRLTRGADVLNLTAKFDGTAVEFDCNFHAEIANHAAAIQAVAAGRLLALRDASLELMQRVYHLELEEGNGDD